VTHDAVDTAMATFNGTPGNDSGVFGYSYLYGGDGNDELSVTVAGHGEVHGDAGDDIVYINPYFPGAYGSVFGGDGDDSGFGGFLDDKLYGGDGNDYLDGRAGNDAVFGDRGRDSVHGGEGDDVLYGGKGNDSGTISTPSTSTPQGPPNYSDLEAGLFGGAGNDRLFGGNGKDALDGGDGSDLIVGGKGQDLLAGGTGNDTFRFKIKDSKPGKTDTILDFDDSDRIDLSHIDANHGRKGKQEFVFIGDDGFGKKAGELKYAGGKVKADVDGDGRADFVIKIEGAPLLNGDHFLL
jgi:Ca2+-binding RTX toxin-like protein